MWIAGLFWILYAVIKIIAEKFERTSPAITFDRELEAEDQRNGVDIMTRIQWAKDGRYYKPKK